LGGIGVLELNFDLRAIVAELNAIEAWFSPNWTSSLSKNVRGKQYRLKLNNCKMDAKGVTRLAGRGKSNQNKIAVIEVRLALDDVHGSGL
jgi:hypothetical protein